MSRSLLEKRPMPLAAIEDALADFRAGKFVIIVDAEDRENEGDLAIAAEFATPQAINFMAREGRGLICLAMTGERLDELRIPMMAPGDDNPRPNRHCHAPRRYRPPRTRLPTTLCTG